MGWLHWPPQTALQTDIATIELALEGCTDLLTLIHGTGKKTDKRGPGKVTPDKFRAFVKKVNRKAQDDE